MGENSFLQALRTTQSLTPPRLEDLLVPSSSSPRVWGGDHRMPMCCAGGERALERSPSAPAPSLLPPCRWPSLPPPASTENVLPPPTRHNPRTYFSPCRLSPPPRRSAEGLGAGWRSADLPLPGAAGAQSCAPEHPRRSLLTPPTFPITSSTRQPPPGARETRREPPRGLRRNNKLYYGAGRAVGSPSSYAPCSARDRAPGLLAQHRQPHG